MPVPRLYSLLTVALDQKLRCRCRTPQTRLSSEHSAGIMPSDIRSARSSGNARIHFYSPQLFPNCQHRVQIRNTSYPQVNHFKCLLAPSRVQTIIDKPLISLTDFVDQFIALMEGYERRAFSGYEFATLYASGDSFVFSVV